MLSEQEKQEFLQEISEGEVYHLKAMLAAAESVRDNCEAPQEARDEALAIILLVNAELEARKQPQVAS